MRWERWARPWDRLTGFLAHARGDLGMLARTVRGDGPAPVLRSARRGAPDRAAAGAARRPTPAVDVAERQVAAGTVRVVSGGVDAALRHASAPSVVTVRHAGGKTRVDVGRGESILDAAERAGIAMPSSCRAGGCGACRVRLLSGTVALPATHCLSASELDAGHVLTCVAAADGAVELEVAP